MITLTVTEARRLAVRAQGLSVPAAERRCGGVPGMLRRLGGVQLDTISVLARSHELVAYARLGAVGRAAVEAAYWSAPDAPAVAFEYWAHAACVLPVEAWPAYAAKRRRYRAKYYPKRQSSDRTRASVLAALKECPLTASDLGGAKNGGAWWDWSEVKVAAEELLLWGDLVVTRREQWRRVYDLPERAIPDALLGEDPPDEECDATLIAHAGRALGVATAADLADYFRLFVATATRTAEPAGLVPVRVEGWTQRAYADPAALAALADGTVPGGSRTTLLSPFDSLVWTRARAERLFGMRHRLEAYVPKQHREHGYFAMPVLAGGRLVGRVDPKRSGTTLVAKQVTCAPGAVRQVATALREAATWVGCDAVVVERGPSPEVAAALREAVA